MHDARKLVGSLWHMWIKPDNLQIWVWSTVNHSPHIYTDGGQIVLWPEVAKVDVVMEISFDIKEETMLSHWDGGECA